jgi:hypothetical protein
MIFRVARIQPGSSSVRVREAGRGLAASSRIDAITLAK